MAHDVFISYSSKDKAIADAVCHFLENGSIKCWIAPRDITPGCDYADIIEEAIKNAKLFIIIFSSNSSSSQWVKSELNIAFSEQIPIIPFKIDESEMLGSNRLILNKTHWIDAYPKYELKLETLVDSAKKILKIDNEPLKIPEEQNEQRRDRTNKKKLWLAVIVFRFILISTCILFFTHLKPHKYSVNNITFETNRLSEKQIEAVKSILQGMREVRRWHIPDG